MRGATFKYLKFMELLGNFNSRSRAGSDFRQLTAEPFQDYFNSRSRAGSDVWCVATLLYLERFQFTLPCGERLTFLFKIFLIYYFNSRSRAGNDHNRSWRNWRRKRFQFTLPCGERLTQKDLMTGTNVISIHAPVRGATWVLILTELWNTIFQFTLPCGERPGLKQKKIKDIRFQFTLPCGERL